MDFLDPQKQKQHVVRLIAGYILIAIIILLTVRLLMYVAQGYTIDKGKIIQNGLVYVSSHPGGGTIKLNNKVSGTTNTRMSLPAGSYQMSIDRSGYETWERGITVEGDHVERFDYPFLFPSNLVTGVTKTLTSAPVWTSQSPSRRWLLLEMSATGKFTLVDLNDSKKIISTNISIPSSVFTPAATDAPQSLKVVEWSNDNRHVLLKRSYDGTYEYVVFDTKDPALSQNISSDLNIAAPIQITLENKKFDQYFVLNPAAHTLGSISLTNKTLRPLLNDVLAFKNYGSNIILYASSQKTSTGQTPVFLFQGNHNYFIRNVTQSNSYLLDLTTFSGSWYIVVGSPNDNRVYVYKNPATVLSQVSNNVLVPVSVLKVDHPNFIKFSDSAQFIMAESSVNFAVYDIQYDDNFVYKMTMPLDKPQIHATWMDGDRLDYISGGKLVVFDYDDANQPTLMAANPNFGAFFNPGYSFVYAVSNSAKTNSPQTEFQLTNTALLTPGDQ